jgi:UDPglucose--hexose-1-phosphate uridylyltransferase
VRVYPHPHPLFRIEGKESRAAEGIYDRMRTVGAHEVVLESATHERQIWLASDREAAEVLGAFAARIIDLKKDQRFRYVTVFKNSGKLAGEEFSHAHSQITATPFIPRRMVYELRSARAYFQDKERCVFCDIVQQEESLGTRVVEATANYLALCPFAARVPYELWVAPRYHAASYEQDIANRGGNVQELAGILRRSLARVQHITEAFHMVLHTTPNTSTQRGVTVQWNSVADDYHWHIEILPITEKRSRSYSIKEVYYSPVSPERAAEALRQA